MTPGQRIKIRRKELDLTQIAVSKAAGITQGALSDIESGASRDLKGTTLSGLAKALKTNTTWIMYGRGKHDSPTLSEEEEVLLEEYGQLNAPNRSAILAAIRALRMSQ